MPPLKAKNVTSCEPIELDFGQVKKAVLALSHLQSKKEESPFDSSAQFIYLNINTQSIPDSGHIKPHAVRVPHRFIPADITICLFVKDAPSKNINYKQLYLPHLPPQSKVIPISSLRTKYSSHNQKRVLATSFDLFITDHRIVPYLPKLLGKAFYQRKKLPIPVDVSQPHLFSKNLDDLLNSTHFYSNGGPCNMVRVGTIGQSVEDIVDNVKAAFPVLQKKYFNDIRSVHMKTSTSVALPVFVRLPEDMREEQAELEGTIPSD